MTYTWEKGVGGFFECYGPGERLLIRHETGDIEINFIEFDGRKMRVNIKTARDFRIVPKRAAESEIY